MPQLQLSFGAGNEAPVIFERAGWYYLLFGNICCFCATGAGARVLVASHPLGNWSDTGIELNPRHVLSLFHTIPSQNNDVFQVTVRKQFGASR